MDAPKQRWINELAKYNTVTHALSRIKEEQLSDQEVDRLVKSIPMIPGGETIVKIFEEKGCDREPESPAPYAMSLVAIKAIFNNLTLEAGRRAELDYSTNSLIHDKADSIDVSVKSARVNCQIHVTNWAEIQQEDPEIKAAMDWCWFDRKKSKLWMQQLLKFKSQPGLNKSTLAGKSLLRNADQLTLCRGLLYHQYTQAHR